MTKPHSTVLAALSFVGAAFFATPGQAQGMTAWYDGQVARQNEVFRQLQSGMVQSNVNNPQFLADYQRGLCGYGLTLEQAAYKWAVTGGCTLEGRRNFMRSRDEIQRRDRAMIQDYRQDQAFRAWEMRRRQERFNINRYEQGMVLGGWKYGYLPDGRYYMYR